jgi:glycosyltransferase involved in cell wall biosynthesis
MIDRSDVIICLSTPPWISLTGLLLKWIKRCKLISWIQDLYPEVAARLGLLREKGWVYKIIEKVSTGILKKAERLVVLSSSMRERLIQKGINPAKVEVVFNWANGRKLFPLLSEKNGFLEKWNLQGKFIVLYSGNMGRCHHFETLLPVIQQLESVQNILFIFIGDGFGNETLRKFRDNHHLKNIHFLPYQKHEDLAKSLSVGDVHLVTLKEGMQDLMVPSKVYSSMAVGRPIIYIGPQAGEVPRILGESQCGWAVKIGDHERLKEYILRLYQDHSLVQALGQQARQFFENNFEQKLSTEKFYICLKEVLKN